MNLGNEAIHTAYGQSVIPIELLCVDIQLVSPYWASMWWTSS